MNYLMAILSLIFSLVFLANESYGQLIDENFDYGTVDTGDVTLITGNWIRHSGLQGPAYKETSLFYPGYISSGIGGRLACKRGSSGINDGDVHMKFSPLNTTTNVFVSFLVQIDTARTTADYFLHIGPNTIGNTYRGRVFARSNGNGWSLSLSKYTETRIDDTTTLNYGQTYLVVLKYFISNAATNDDEVMLYVYSSGVPSSEPGSPLVNIGPTGFGTTNDPSNIGSVALRQGDNTPTAYIDGIRVDTSWNNVIPTNVHSSKSNFPATLALMNNYPNPFNSNTILRFSSIKSEYTVLRVINLIGQEVARLFKGNPQPGTLYTVQFNTAGLSSGLYIAHLEQGNKQVMQKMILVK